MLETYDWNQLITQEDRMAVLQDIKAIVDQGDWYENSPNTQTKIDVFSKKILIGPKLRMSFLGVALLILV